MKQILIAAIGWLAAVVAAPGAEPLVFEAEWAWRMDAPVALILDPDCSGGLAVTIPDGSTEDNPMQKGQALLDLWLGDRPAGFTRLWARVRWEDVCGNSFVCTVTPGGVRRTTVTGAIMKKWYWVAAARLKESNRPAALHLWNREDGISVDQFALLPPGTRPPMTGAPLPTGRSPAVRDTAVPPISILFSRPVGKSLTEGLEIHPVHLLKPNTNQWARNEVFVSTGEPARVCIWIRNTRLIETNVTVQVQAPVGLSVDARAAPGAVSNAAAGGTGQILTWHKTLKSGEPLLGIPLDLSAGDFPMTTRPLRIQVRAGADILAEGALQVTRPMDWMMIGPFPNSEKEATALMQALLLQSTAAGSFPDFTSAPGGDDGGADRLRLNPARHLGACGRIDLNAVFGQQNNCCAFAYTSVTAGSARSFPFLIENDDGIRIWVNGTEVYRNQHSVPAITSRRQFDLPLIQGRNHVLVRINQIREHWQFRLSPDGTNAVHGVPFEF